MNSEKLSLEELINSFPKIEKSRQHIAGNLSAAIWFLDNAETIKEYLIILVTQ